jgi:hypothetical protein
LWPSGLRRGSAADCLLGLRVRIPPEAWMFVLCVFYSKYKRHKPGQSAHRSTDKAQTEQKKNPGGGDLFRTRPHQPSGKAAGPWR